ncbi:hypothetical protein Pcinc_014023 [Petrolisthes cinctipes]|uniref:Cysteine protease n=1 Tax=Petrolisthes cinctipes TaxID=88211 RepID=A0AAE1FXV3_PETCI|nr:hypothetical protein Pcinc_014023 [Petrolisthes cinctipes]
MIPTRLLVGRQECHPHQPSEIESRVTTIPLGQECTEASGLMYVQDHFHHPSTDRDGTSILGHTSQNQSFEAKSRVSNIFPQADQKGGSELTQVSQDKSQTNNQASVNSERYSSQGLSRVKLTKSHSPTKESCKYYVRAAGGMSVPVPELVTESVDVSENTKMNSASQSIPRLEEETSKSKPPGTGLGGGYLPLGVELIAGRGQTSMPSDGNKNTINPRVRSLPPSHTLALSASLIKSYFTSSGEKQQQGTRSQAGVTSDTETVKTKVMGIWNNVKYGWTVNLKTNFSRDSPVYLLGCVYHKSLGEEGEEAEEGERHGMEWFKRHFYSLVWCTYRRQFPALQDSSLTTDCGWGCMLRSGQMMLTHALTRHFLSSDWRYSKPGSGTDTQQEAIHRAIVRWIGDAPSPQCPLSLHNLVHFGRRLGKQAGDWYGPASVAYICKEAVEMGSKYVPDLKRVCVYVAQDCAVYIQDVLDLCSTSCICDAGILSKWAKQPFSSSPATHDTRNSSRPFTTSSQQQQTSSESSHTCPSYSHPNSQLPQVDNSANVNITRINVDSAVGDLPIRLFVNHAERQPQIRNGHSGEEGHCGSVKKKQSSDANSSGSAPDHCVVKPMHLDSISVDTLKTNVSGISGQAAYMSRQVQGSSKPYTVSTEPCSQVQESASVAKETELPRKKTDNSKDDQASANNTHSSNMCSKCENWRSVLIMVPVRLGGESLNPIYHPCIYSLFTHDLSVGIIGGRPKHSLYFVGFQEESLIHLDPHLVQDAVSVTQSNFPLTSYHCPAPRKMALSRMDPSATFGFYCHTRTDFLRLMEELPELVTPKEPGLEYPIFEFVDGRSEDSDACARQVTSEDQRAATLPQDTPLLPQDSEEFVFL